MIENIILDYLNNALSVPVFMEEKQNMPMEYILIEKTGSGELDHTKSAVFATQSFSVSLYKAALLNEQVKEAMRNIIILDDISRCRLNTDYNYTDTARKKYRYQAVFDIVHY